VTNQHLTVERLREVLDYDPETGVFTWRIKTSKKVIVGNIAGFHLHHGYLRIKVDKTDFLSHRLAWHHWYGEWPQHGLDHINGVRSDNRITNLRSVPQSINRQNQRIAHGHSKTGLLGVHVHRNRFEARIQVNGKTISLGGYASAEEANLAYLKAKRVLHVGCTI
jgi:hypothetical protein